MDYELEFPANSYRDELFSISELFHENTKQRRLGPPGAWNVSPALLERMRRPFKVYATAERTTLNRDLAVLPGSVEDAIQRRRTRRDFTGDAITVDELSRLLFFTAGITSRSEGAIPLFCRAAPSAGALYPLEVYPVVLEVTSLERGVYHYDVREHALEFLQAGDHRPRLYECTHRQDMVLGAALLLAITAVFIRTRIKYGERGYRHILLEAGHMAQNAYLVGTTMDLGVATIGGFFDDEINELLGVDGVDEGAVYLVVVGRV